MRLFVAAGAAILITMSVLTPSVSAQSAPTTNIFTRVLMVESGYGRGTIFSVNLDNREYWITAKHILTGAKHPPYGSVKEKSAQLKILNPGGEGEEWLPEDFSVVDTGDDIDIVVLAPPKPILNAPSLTEPMASATAIFGGDCEFLGFPYGGGWRGKFPNDKSFWMPYVKHCTISAEATNDPTVWVLDGINNEGFSGGPVIFGSGAEQKIMAVISGYVTEPAEVLSSLHGSDPESQTAQEKTPNTEKKKEVVNLNSGFIIAYDIKYAVDAIQKDPIGPLLSPNSQTK